MSDELHHRITLLEDRLDEIAAGFAEVVVPPESPTRWADGVPVTVEGWEGRRYRK